MSPKISNEYGVISIDNEVVLRIAGQSVMECAGVVGMAAKNVKDGIVQILKKENLAKGIEIIGESGEISINLHIIVGYGTNIPAITETVYSNVKYKVEEFAGVVVQSINIFVDDIKAEG